jgi:Transposase, Mutator family.
LTRSNGIDELIISLYSKNELSTKKVSEILKTIFQNSYSRSRISIITEITREEVKRFLEHIP